jgi:CubicO group peptidase (beta-lactamase class C family)
MITFMGLTAIVRGGELGHHDQLSPPAPWWSLTKAALAAGALVLVAGGRLDLDIALAGRPFTLRQLLQHTAGLSDYGALPAYHEAVARRAEPWSADELLRQVSADTLLFSPGQGWAYSNVGYFFVRRLIEEATGEEMDAALRRLVFGPLSLPGVRLARAPSDLTVTAWGNEARYHPGWVHHGLLIGTPAEAALFLDRLLSGPLLPSDLRDAMETPHPLGGPIPGRPWRTAGYGLGLMVDVASPRGRCSGHTGQGPGSTAAAYRFADLDPPCTAAAFAPVEDQGLVERAVLALPEAMS